MTITGLAKAPHLDSSSEPEDCLPSRINGYAGRALPAFDLTLAYLPTKDQLLIFLCALNNRPKGTGLVFGTASGRAIDVNGWTLRSSGLGAAYKN